jgi:ATP-dependent Lon protease
MQERNIPTGAPLQMEPVPVPDALPILTISEGIVFPFMVFPFVVESDKWGKLIDDASLGNKIIAFFWRTSPGENFQQNEIARTGTAARIARLMRTPDGTIQLILQGLARVQIAEMVHTEPYPFAKVEVIQDPTERTAELEGLSRAAQTLFTEVVNAAPYLPNEMAAAITGLTEPGSVADFVASQLNIPLPDRQAVLDTVNVGERLRRAVDMLQREKEILEIGQRAQQEMNKTQREYILRQQMEQIRKELGETNDQEAEINELRAQLEKAQLPEDAQREAQRELERLKRMPPGAAEYTVARTYLDWLVTLPWNKSTEDNMDINHAREVLDEDHYDLERVKDRILEQLAVRKLNPGAKSPILCLVGPPGVGKTSLGQSIARALGRKFERISLGGVRDEAEIRGHRRTYIGALPGRILQAIRRAGTNNPVFMLDEIDKMSAGFQGDPAAALLEVLDPEQNNTFVDHYVDVPFDLSKVMFICTANVMDTIPSPLLDRMEVLTLSGYTETEKLHIANRYLVPRQRHETGLDNRAVEITEGAIRRLIREYTREAGVRNLERAIGNVFRKIARWIGEGLEGPFTIDEERLNDVLEPPRFRTEVLLGEDEVGVVTGLAWTPTGGDILFIEAAVIPGRGNVTLTGQLGNVMQESAQAALTYTRSRSQALGIDESFPQKCDLHIHIPAGAIPKDGPSAGITMATSIVSAITRRKVYKKVAMTGEITLSGRVLPIGGVKEKVLAAQRAGVHTILLPKDNQVDLREVPQSVREKLKFIFVEHMDEVLAAALAPEEAKTPEPAPAVG